VHLMRTFILFRKHVVFTFFKKVPSKIPDSTTICFNLRTEYRYCDNFLGRVPRTSALLQSTVPTTGDGEIVLVQVLERMQFTRGSLF